MDTPDLNKAILGMSMDSPSSPAADGEGRRERKGNGVMRTNTEGGSLAIKTCTSL
jgi:hypothetical protein